MDNPRAGLSTKGKPGISESPQDLGPGFSVGQLQAQSNAKMAAWMGGMYQMKKKKNHIKTNIAPPQEINQRSGGTKIAIFNIVN